MKIDIKQSNLDEWHTNGFNHWRRNRTFPYMGELLKIVSGKAVRVRYGWVYSPYGNGYKQYEQPPAAEDWWRDFMNRERYDDLPEPISFTLKHIPSKDPRHIQF